ncbi:hypothetical protein, partial [Prochlorococcus sp. MIT 0701]|uniref:hypothetical protein n=1 Tax=Prochlorococcus sp. MIT 0701 TaxID=1499502 RepID=UPI0019D3EA9A
MTTSPATISRIRSRLNGLKASSQNSLVNLRKAFYMHFIIESVLSERVELIPASSLRETIS